MSQKHVEELERAKDRIMKHECKYICDALRLKEPDIYTPYIYYNAVATEIKKEIDKAIENKFSVSEWLYDVYGIELTLDEQREYRMQWIDRMIEYWKDKP